MEHIEPNTIVTLDLPNSYTGHFDYYEKLLGVKNKEGTVLCLGEITNMRGHYSVVAKDGRVVYGLHPDIFRLPTDDEL